MATHTHTKTFLFCFKDHCDCETDTDKRRTVTVRLSILRRESAKSAVTMLMQEAGGELYHCQSSSNEYLFV